MIKLTIKISSEKSWLGLLYEFPFSLNPGDKPNDARACKTYFIISSKYRRPDPGKFKEKLMDI